jgi:hypothetical protein
MEALGFLSSVLSFLLKLRIETERLKKDQPGIQGHRLDLEVNASYLFWLYWLQEAKFVQIQIPEDERAE